MNRNRFAGIVALALLCAGCGKEIENTVHLRNDLKVLRLKSVEFRGTRLFSEVGPVSSNTRTIDEAWQDRYCGTAGKLEIVLEGPLGTARVHTLEEFTFQAEQDKSIVIDDSTKFVNY